MNIIICAISNFHEYNKGIQLCLPEQQPLECKRSFSHNLKAPATSRLRCSGATQIVPVFYFLWRCTWWKRFGQHLCPMP